MINASHLSRSFGPLRAVDDVSLHVGAGQIYGLVGPDGAGKTTFIRLLCGAIRASAGEATIAGYPVAQQPEQARAQIGYLSQRFSLYEEMTVLENIRFFAEVRGLPAAEWRPRCHEILQFVGLEQFSDRRARLLSGGMKQKLGLATALVHRPRIILLDEPTTGVDPLTRQDFWQLIIRLVAEEGVAVLVSTPYMDEASRCGRVGFLHHGHLLTEGSPTELRARLQGRVLELAGQPLQALRRAAATDEEVENVQMFGDRLHLRVRDGAAERVTERLYRQAGEAVHVTRLRVIPPQLEDVFIALSGEAQ
ncbi:MAG: ABC transporter ATP-binding protein [Chloroflexi bacterium]|nr:ABC transporter ATP-binding protein [Chloroflexota bacterium]